MFEENYETRKTELRTSKGYRLKVSTHNLIKSLQELTREDADTVITQSCLLMYKKVIEGKEKNIE
jgi:hypothetical protein